MIGKGPVGGANKRREAEVLLCIQPGAEGDGISLKLERIWWVNPTEQLGYADENP